ncbi:hypothetical protein EXU48_10975 [Occultella glacieicola]|uniref:PepSY domain-containing protein n=1 Tax=Occultella glacieicola TaxID=2518684 RepID=A0ABY2E3I4_9MICO|nr:hypothetical protein [Occultella glacieicola]TDE93977.1 hypothetical protein EXU48_10975 [Occultella glacieicola]
MLAPAALVGALADTRTTGTVWAGFDPGRTVEEEDSSSATDWWVSVDDGTSGPLPVDGPGGVVLGQRIDAVRAEHPQAPIESFVHEGVAYDYVHLDPVTHEGDGGSYDLAVEVGARDGVVTHLGAPVHTEGDC